jgi:GNAT superfamily N-acetyltransferase
MPATLQDLSQPALTAAIEGNLFAFLAKWSDWPRVEVHNDPEWLWSISDIGFPLFNFVVRENFPASEANHYIEAAIARCKTRRIPMLWWTGPSTRPTDLGARLVAHGFDHTGKLPGMALDLASWKDNQNVLPGLAIEQVLDRASAEVWIHPLMLGYGLPEFIEAVLIDSLTALELGAHVPLRHYLARLNGEPVATVTLCLGAGVAGLYNVTTVNSARGHGIGTAVTSAVLHAARDEGYRAAVLHSSVMGFNIYQRLGFKEYCQMNQYVWSP